MQGRVFGVASRGDLDCEIAVYGDVSSWGPFIADAALDAAAMGGYTPAGWATGEDDEWEEASFALLPESPAAANNGCSMSPTSSGKAPAGLAGLLLCLAWLHQRRRHAPALPPLSA
jgi:MYXO-CTERM domain-containing protein